MVEVTLQNPTDGSKHLVLTPGSVGDVSRAVGRATGPTVSLGSRARPKEVTVSDIVGLLYVTHARHATSIEGILCRHQEKNDAESMARARKHSDRDH